MPGARKGMPGARAPSAKKSSKAEKLAAAKTGAKTAEGVNKYMPNQGHGAHANMAATQGAQKLLKKASLLQTLLARKESSETRIRLAEIWIELKESKNLAAAKECLETCLKKDPADPLGARRVLTPLLLELLAAPLDPASPPALLLAGLPTAAGPCLLVGLLGGAVWLAPPRRLEQVPV